MPQFSAAVLLVYFVAITANAQQLHDMNSISEDNSTNGWTASLQIFLKNFGKYLPVEVKDLLEHMTAEDMKTIRSINYSNVTTEEQFLAELDKKDPKLAEKIRAANTTIFTKIDALSAPAREYMMKSINSSKWLGISASTDTTVKTLANIITEYMALPEATKREIVTAFPCVGEIMNSESVKAWMDERDKTQDSR